LGKGFEVCSNKGPGPLQRGDTKMSKWVGIILKFLLKIYWPRKADIYMKAF
jgi:hypothetical protein